MKLDNLPTNVVLLSVFVVSTVVMVICTVWLIPYFHRRLVQEDWTMRWYHVFFGPALLFKGPVPPVPENVKVEIVQDFYRGHSANEDVKPARDSSDNQSEAILASDDLNSSCMELDNEGIKEAGSLSSLLADEDSTNKSIRLHQDDIDIPFYKKFWLLAKRTVFRGLFVSVVKEQTRGGGSKLEQMLSENIGEMHSRSARYDNKTEYLYSLLQVFTATTASFAHGYPHLLIPF